MFTGQYRHAIDEKGRMMFPVEYREQLADGGFIMCGLDHNLMVLPNAMVEQVRKHMSEFSFTDPVARDLLRQFFSSANPLEFDKTGRINIKQFQREAAGLTDSAVITASGGFLEIWSPERWAEKQASLMAGAADAFSSIHLPLY